MEVIIPQQVNTSVVTDSNIPEPHNAAGEYEFDANRKSGVQRSVSSGSFPPESKVTSLSGFIAVLSTFSLSADPEDYAVNFFSADTGAGVGNIYYDNSYKNDQYAAIGGGRSNNTAWVIAKDRGGFGNSIRLDLLNTANASVGTGFSPVYLGTASDSSAGGDYIQTYCAYDVNGVCYILSEETGVKFKIQSRNPKGSLKQSGSLSTSGTITSSSIPLGMKNGKSGMDILFNVGGTLKIATYSLNLSSNMNPLVINDVNLGSLDIAQVLGFYAHNGETFIAMNDDKYCYKLDDNFSVLAGYTPGEKAAVSVEHKVYQAVANTIEYPPTGVNSVPPTWVEVGATNRYAAFDGVIYNPVKFYSGTGDSDITESEITYTLKPTGDINSIAFFNVKGANSISITQRDIEGNIVMVKESDMYDNSDIVDWYSYFFSPIITSNQALFTGFLPYKGGSYDISIVGGNELSVGEIVLGSGIYIGESQYNTSLQLQDFSTKSRDVFGNFQVVRRGTSKLVNYDIKTDRTKVGYIYNQLENVTSIPCVFVGVDVYNDATTVYGYYKDLTINIDAPSICSVTLSVEGLV